MKKNWIKIFSKPNDFPDKETALKKLKDAILKQHASNVSGKTSPDKLEERFNGCLELMTGGKNEISFGTGEWLNMIQGEKGFKPNYQFRIFSGSEYGWEISVR